MMMMSKYIVRQGFKEKKIGSRGSNTDDMIDKQFYLVDSPIEVDTELSTMDSLEFEVTENYQMFLKTYDAVKFIVKLRAMVTAANTAGLCITFDESVLAEVVRQEQGFLIDLTFTIKGV